MALLPQAWRDTARAMSQENVERVRAGFEAHNRGDLDALVELYDPEAVFETLCWEPTAATRQYG